MRRSHWIVLLLGLLSFSCIDQQSEALLSHTDDAILHIPERLVLKTELTYHHQGAIWTLGDELYSGFAVDYYPDHSLKEKFGILNGKKQHKTMQWYPDGHLKRVINYHKGQLHGVKKIWSADTLHVLIAQLNYNRGKAHGEQKKWYSTGELYKTLNLYHGKEEGVQQAYRKNGTLYANYEARHGRIFGLKRATPCYELEDENIQMAER
ncbi:toxin-antitoxin system YwqK family antitoxin [Winogradskyella flava]|uniref:toxin-antitoxin system YwqK family antitoxin n=1 Tax=Winogradskyella flava TaxID=1884876 RepID=UPI00249396A7|nr:hypothetical protein [Winogradskyella flava]